MLIMKVAEFSSFHLIQCTLHDPCININFNIEVHYNKESDLPLLPPLEDHTYYTIIYTYIRYIQYTMQAIAKSIVLLWKFSLALQKAPNTICDCN